MNAGSQRFCRDNHLDIHRSLKTAYTLALNQVLIYKNRLYEKAAKAVALRIC